MNRLCATCIALFALMHTCAISWAQSPGAFIKPEAAARIEKLANDPFRWIILHGTAPKTTEPIKSSANQRATRTSTRTPVNQSSETSTTNARSKQFASGALVSEGRVLRSVIDFASAKKMTDGSIEAIDGAFVEAKINTFSFNSPNPVSASLDFDTKRKLVRLDYGVPETVGLFGGAGIRINLVSEEVSLAKQLIQGDQVGGMLIAQIDVKFATRLKIFIIGHEDQLDGAYPYFILPVEPGLRTYGLLLEDAIQPEWSATAPDIAKVLQKVMGVGIEYSRGDALGQADHGSFWVGSIRFSQVKQVAAR